jgi:glycosyltransferase involved in cell wall biosynthesis
MQVGIVVPCYNEQEILPEISHRLLQLLDRLKAVGKVSTESGIWLVDDGSTEQTWLLIERLATEHQAMHGIKLSRNRGHQNALVAGLQNTPGDALISIDADLQDDISVVETMIDRFQKGHEIVYGVRDNRESDTPFKRWTAEGYYRLLRLMGVEAVFNHADYRLLSRRVLEHLNDYREINLFLRGIIPLLGFRSTNVSYARSARFAGESKYPFRKMLGLAIDGVTSFSVVPLRLITLTGVGVFLASLAMGTWALWIRYVTQTAIPGWTSTVVPFYFLGGVQLFCIGVVGEYLSKIYIEVKARPRYHVEKQV